ncbi:MAG: tRNA preQ1(34) S-adenosylmethionine ribosyltransferase-isomerase QueA [Methylococcales bacterium]|nr:tRNA preQ1(34) S-adenosylmethionine ribosyltransferase-isomerase QueA [Methylococcales bacterium]
MKKTDFTYVLPEALIAQAPLTERDASRLLVLDRADGHKQDKRFTDFPTLLSPDDLLVFNDTRVIPARLWGRKATGGQVEILIERIVDSQRALAHIRASKAPKPGSQILLLEHAAQLTVIRRQGALFELECQGGEAFPELLEVAGHMPLPPYITRQDQPQDWERYQTVFARHKGAVAAPTASLHFTEALLRQLTAQGVAQTFITLHVASGTFQPVRVDNLDEHDMHQEFYAVTPETVAAIKATRNRGGRVIAVGTTVLRALESAALQGALKPCQGETKLFIRPGFEFKVVDALLTNFHLPESTLLMLVSAFASVEQIRAAYQHAIDQRYRFFSYGDAMFIV